ncbi:MAG: hypothetical protein HY943_21065 [Gammaproteobacteria bacterium]|nr:hypothetical protein [Gammaproteobacteria bacterium]
MTDDDKRRLLAELDELLRSMPAALGDNSDESAAWLGHASAVMRMFGFTHSVPFEQRLNELGMAGAAELMGTVAAIHRHVYAARSELLLQLPSAGSAAFAQDREFDYFDELRKIIETARTDLFFIDPYINPDFVARYLPMVHPGVSVRLFTNQYLITVVPAVEAFAAQSGLRIEIRDSEWLHDRHVIVDGTRCVQSGASFKDGAKRSPTALIEITDTFQATRDDYETRWRAAPVIR